MTHSVLERSSTAYRETVDAIFNSMDVWHMAISSLRLRLLVRLPLPQSEIACLPIAQALIRLVIMASDKYSQVLSYETIAVLFFWNLIH
jgi:hypothetical protein